jgi:hypothetical protein
MRCVHSGSHWKPPKPRPPPEGRNHRSGARASNFCRPARWPPDRSRRTQSARCPASPAPFVVGPCMMWNASRQTSACAAWAWGGFGIRFGHVQADRVDRGEGRIGLALAETGQRVPITVRDTNEHLGHHRPPRAQINDDDRRAPIKWRCGSLIRMTIPLAAAGRRYESTKEATDSVGFYETCGGSNVPNYCSVTSSAGSDATPSAQSVGDGAMPWCARGPTSATGIPCGSGSRSPR